MSMIVNIFRAKSFKFSGQLSMVFVWWPRLATKIKPDCIKFDGGFEPWLKLKHAHEEFLATF